MNTRILKGSALVALTATLAACGAFQNSAPNGANLPSPQNSASLQSLPTGDMVDETPQLWFVELQGAPTADGGSLAATETEQRNFRAEARRGNVNFMERRAFGKLFNGLSVEIKPGELAKLSRLPGVKAIWPVETMSLPETETSSDPDMANAVKLTDVHVAQSELGLTGKGVRVAIMDTGIDREHPDFGDRIVTGWGFVQNEFGTPGVAPVESADWDDCNGHGTHVAGIVGANGKVRGVAPDVTFGAYKVFGCEGSTTADIMMAAMERALDDGMDILNMSIGSAYQWPDYPTAKAATRLVNKGMVVVASIGNSGATGAFSAGAPGLGEKVIGVASFDNTHITSRQFLLSPDNTGIRFNTASGAPLAPSAGTYPLARTGTPATPDDACAALPANSLKDQVVLIRRGACAFGTKALNAQSAGAAGVIIYNSAPGDLSPTVAGAGITIPVVAVTQADGVTINDRIAAGNASITWTAEPIVVESGLGNRLSSFTSYGLSPDLTLKPDIGGPGGFIYSTYPIEKGEYISIGGTSMSSPHVAGVAALVLQAKPNTPSQAMRSILQNTALPKTRQGDENAGALDHVHRQGAGMVNAVRAATATTHVEPSKLSLGESEHGPVTRTITIENGSDTAVTYTLSNVDALASSGASTQPTPLTQAGASSVSFSASSVSVPAGGSATVNVTVAPSAALADNSQYGGYVQVSDGEQVVAHVPYAGFKGDYQTVRVLTRTKLLAKVAANGSIAPQGDGAEFDIKQGVFPYFIAHLDHQSRRLRGEVIDTRTGRNYGLAFDREFLGRNSSPTAIFGYAFDGTTTNGGGKQVRNVPAGTYTLKVSVLKALGDESNPNHWETWTSPSFQIKR